MLAGIFDLHVLDALEVAPVVPARGCQVDSAPIFWRSVPQIFDLLQCGFSLKGIGASGTPVELATSFFTEFRGYAANLADRLVKVIL
jgi:hypothetical protein